MKNFYCFVVLLSLTGCCLDRGNEQVIKFRRASPKEFNNYVYIYPVSLDTYYYLHGQQRGAITSLIRVAEIEERKYGTTPGLKEHLETWAKEAGTNQMFEVENYRDLEKSAADGGVICQFKWDDGKTCEMGMLVIKGGVVIKRDVWVTDFHSERTNKLNSTRQP